MAGQGFEMRLSAVAPVPVGFGPAPLSELEIRLLVECQKPFWLKLEQLVVV